MKRGEVWWVDFEPAIGSEVRKQRPAVIVSNDVANAHLDRVQVVPLTMTTGKVYSSEALVFFRGKRQKAIADQIMTADKSRFDNRIGRLSAADMELVEKAILIQLGLVDWE
ncbi:MAG: type II toxin-antitoxin system PemK/MazF family toxin [Planctomycetaceae bacterium]